MSFHSIETKQKCFLDTYTFQVCPDNCKSNLSSNPWMVGITCIAVKKMSSFLEGENTFTVAISAFLQSQPKFVEEFASESEGNLDLVRYFLSICEKGQIKVIIENLSNQVICQILKLDYENYLKVKKMLGRTQQITNYFSLKGSKYWTDVSDKKKCTVMEYLIKEKQDYKLASEFLAILAPESISKLKILASLTEEEERNLYISLEDNIYSLPLISPKIYDHMLTLFQDNLEIYFILETMAELVKRKSMIEDTTQSFIKYRNKNGQNFSIQWIFSELYGLEYELVVEILGQLKEKDFISNSERSTLQSLLKTGSLDFLKDMKQEILKSE